MIDNIFNLRPFSWGMIRPNIIIIAGYSRIYSTCYNWSNNTLGIPRGKHMFGWLFQILLISRHDDPNWLICHRGRGQQSTEWSKSILGTLTINDPEIYWDGFQILIQNMISDVLVLWDSAHIFPISFPYDPKWFRFPPRKVVVGV